jgi:hypothetical protein
MWLSQLNHPKLAFLHLGAIVLVIAADIGSIWPTPLPLANRYFLDGELFWLSTLILIIAIPSLALYLRKWDTRVMALIALTYCAVFYAFAIYAVAFIAGPIS